MPSYRDDWRPASRVPDHSLALFGAGVCHTPASEAADYGTCSHCGGAARDGRGLPVPNRPRHADPVKVAEGVVVAYDPKGRRLPRSYSVEVVMVCGHCKRTPFDGTGALATATHPGDGQMREGFDLPTPDTDADGRTARAVGQAPGNRPDRAAELDRAMRQLLRRKSPAKAR